MNEDLRSRISFVLDLEVVILACKRQYYGSSNRIVDDQTYDQIEKTMERACPDHPILQYVGYMDGTYRRLSPEQTRKLLERNHEEHHQG